MSSTVIGIIGSGNIGKSIARMATEAGLPVVLANSRGPESLTDVVTALGDLASADVVEGAIARADIVVLAVPLSAVEHLPSAHLTGKTVIDATNYYPDRDGRIDALDTDQRTSSAFLAERLDGARLVKALNNVDFLRLPMLTRAAGSDERTALPIAGDDASAKAAVIELLDAIGFDALDLGGLAESWRSEPNTPIYVAPYFRPSDDAAADPMQQFMSAAPVPVPLAQARELAASAQR